MVFMFADKLQPWHRLRFKRIPIYVFVALLGFAWNSAANEIPSIEEIQVDIKQFQSFFVSRFPVVSLESYRHGAASLPQFAKQQINRDLHLLAPPYVDEVEAGRIVWNTPMASGLSLRDCFKGKPPPFAYPYFYDGKIHTIVGDVNSCRSQNGEPTLDPIGNQMARLVAVFRQPWQGLPLDVDFREEEVRRHYAIGRQYFWAKRGQMNLSCANCHVHNSGNRLRGHVLSTALGHGMGHPAYSILGSLQGQPMRTLHQQYAYCNARAGAAPLTAQSETYIGLEIYQAIMNSGIPLSAPGLRP